MHTNETGREPTEPTDAAAEAIEVLRQRFARWWHEVGSGIAPMAMEEWSEHAERVARAAWVDGAFMSSARPMPDTPAPDEVARLNRMILARDDEYEVVRSEQLELLTANTALTARVAELEAELAAVKASCRIVLGFGKAIISDASINGILDGAPTTLLFQTVDEEHTIGMDATGYGRDNLEPGDGNVQIVFTKAESVDVVMDTLVKIKGAIEAAPGKEPTSE